MIVVNFLNYKIQKMFEIFVNMESQLSIQSHLRKEAQNRYLLIVISTFVKKNSYNKIVTIFN
jgi:hypothetical protein